MLTEFSLSSVGMNYLYTIKQWSFMILWSLSVHATQGDVGCLSSLTVTITQAA